MIKKSLLSMFIGVFILIDGLLLAHDTKNCMCKAPDLTTMEKVVIGGLLGVAFLAVSPHVLTAGVTVKIAVAIKTAASAGGTYLISTPPLGKIWLGLTAAQMARPYILQTTEEKLNELLKEKAARSARTKDEFISCLKANKTDSPRNELGRPCACEEIALLYALNSSVSELNKRTEAFKKNACFCY